MWFTEPAYSCCRKRVVSAVLIFYNHFSQQSCNLQKYDCKSQTDSTSWTLNTTCTYTPHISLFHWLLISTCATCVCISQVSSIATYVLMISPPLPDTCFFNHCTNELLKTRHYYKYHLPLAVDLFTSVELWSSSITVTAAAVSEQRDLRFDWLRVFINHHNNLYSPSPRPLALCAAAPTWTWRQSHSQTSHLSLCDWNTAFSLNLTLLFSQQGQCLFS